MYEVGVSEPVIFLCEAENQETRTCLLVVWVQTCLSLFLLLVYLISSENNSIVRFEKKTF